MRLARLSRLVALVLRHRPEEVGLSLDPAGFAALDALAGALSAQPGWESVSASDLMALASSDPRRYEVRDGRMRARYGHTIAVEEPGEAAVPPEWLYYGTSPADVGEIRVHGLRPTSRQYVHLSTTPLAAADVGRRHAPDAVVIVIFARSAESAGVGFRRAGPALFLTGAIPPEFLLLPEAPARAQPAAPPPLG
jgi:putative RNA 2'-phosphotransferase